MSGARENSFSFGAQRPGSGSPAKALAAANAAEPESPGSWSLKAHPGGSASKIPKPAPSTPSGQGIKSQVGARRRRQLSLAACHLAGRVPHPALVAGCRACLARPCPRPASRACGRRLLRRLSTS